MTLPVPDALRRLGAHPPGSAWLAELPALVERCTARWSLRIGAPYPGAQVAWVAPVTLPGGEAAVLKVQLPHRESDHEAAALAAWDGQGAVRLLAADPADSALLLERAEPGDHLSTRPAGEALDVIAGLLPRLWIPAAEPFLALADEAAEWVRSLPLDWERVGRPFDRRLLGEAVELIEHLAATQEEGVLQSQDLHADNVLRASREPWLVIDPKPVVGERAFGLAPVIRSYELGHSRRDVLHRLDFLAERLDVDRERARGWALGQTLAWAFDEGTVLPHHVETASWLRAS